MGSSNFLSVDACRIKMWPLLMPLSDTNFLLGVGQTVVTIRNRQELRISHLVAICPAQGGQLCGISWVEKLWSAFLVILAALHFCLLLILAWYVESSTTFILLSFVLFHFRGLTHLDGGPLHSVVKGVMRDMWFEQKLVCDTWKQLKYCHNPWICGPGWRMIFSL